MIEQLEVVKVEHPSEPEPELTSLFSEIIENILEAVVEISSSVMVSKTAKSKPKIHLCSKCGKCFSQYLSSKKHMKSCSGFNKVRRSVICTLCKKSYYENWNLKETHGVSSCQQAT